MRYILFRIYWNHSAMHDFETSTENVCSETLLSDGLSAEYPNLSGRQWTAPRIEGGAETIRRVARFCKRYNFDLQISNEMTDQIAADATVGVKEWMDNRLKRVLDEERFTGFFFEEIEQDAPKNLPENKEYIITVLSADHPIEKGIWCRPLSFMYGDFGGDGYQQTGTYGGVINNYKWIPLEDLLGPRWFEEGRTLGDYMERGAGPPYEFVKGHLPPEHCTSKDQIRRASGD